MKVNLRKYRKGPGERSIDVHIDSYDTWCLDHSLALIILPALIQLKHTKNGVPSEFCGGIGSDMDRNYCFDFIKEDENRVFDEKCEKWDEVFDKMIWSFQQIVDDESENKYQTIVLKRVISFTIILSLEKQKKLTNLWTKIQANTGMIVLAK